MDKEKFSDDTKKKKKLHGEEIPKESLVKYIVKFVGNTKDPGYSSGALKKAKGDSHTPKNYRTKALSIKNGSSYKDML